MKTTKLLVCLFCILCAGCGNGQEVIEPSPTPNTTQAVFSTLGSKEIEGEGDASIIAEQSVKENTAELAKYNAMNRIGGTSYFCIDDETGAVYFVNQNKDWYIYRLVNGKAELAVKMPAKELYTWDGNLYFMLESHGIYDLGEKSEGDIYCYNPVKGSVELVNAAGADGSDSHEMRVTEDGIYYSASIPKEIELNGTVFKASTKSLFYLPFGAVEPENDTTNGVIDGWKNYYLSNVILEGENASPENPAPLRLISRTNGTKEMIELHYGWPHQYCVIGDELYYTKTNSVIVTVQNLETNEWKEYDFTGVYIQTNEYSENEFKSMQDSGNYQFLSSFTITNNGKSLWTTSGLNLYCLDMLSGEISSFRLMDGSYTISNLYTDGELLYALYAPGNNGVPVVVRIVTEEVTKDILERNAFRVEYLTD